MSDKHRGFLRGDQVKVWDPFHHNSPLKHPQIGVVLKVVPSGGVVNSNRIHLLVPSGVTWRWEYDVECL